MKNTSFKLLNLIKIAVLAVILLPAPSFAASVFYRAINLNGPSTTIDGLSYSAGTNAANFTLTSAIAFANQNINLIPSTDTARAQMIRSSVYGKALKAVLKAVPNGTYEVYLYNWEDNAASTFSLALNGVNVVTNLSSGSAGTWRKLGPFTTNVSSGTITLLSSGGDFNLSGMEFFKVTSSTPTPTPLPTATPVQTTQVENVVLINNTTRSAIAGFNPIADGNVINLGSLPTQDLSIQANMKTGVSPGSVNFTLVGGSGSSYAHAETNPPYFLCTDYVTCPSLNTPDSYTLTVQPYSGANLSGSLLGTAYTVHFTIANAATPTPTPVATTSVQNVMLINNVTQAPIAGFNPIVENAVIDLSSLPTSNLSIQSNMKTGVTPGSVNFSLTGSSGSNFAHLEVNPPYFLCTDYVQCPSLNTPDTYTLKVQPYVGADATTATLGLPYTVHFRITGNALTSINVLFIGNSLIGNATASTGEDTPTLIAHLASTRGQTLQFTKVINFGHSLQETWDAGLIGNNLSGATKWDYILLQEYSTLVTSNQTQFNNTVLNTYKPALSQSLKTGGKVILFKNWAMMDFSPFASRAANVTAINNNYASLSSQLTLPNYVAPISDGFEKVFTTRSLSYLIISDGKHPTDEAIYMNACILYGVFFGQSPSGFAPLWLTPSEGSFLQGSAATVLGY